MTNTPSATPGFAFTGDVAVNYEEFLGPLFFEPYAIEVEKRIDPDGIQLALELACGTGRVTRHIREKIPTSAKLVASDISDDMMAIAQQKVTAPGIEWRIIDAQSLPFDDNSVDLVVCCFGYMFVADKPKAFAEVYRILKPGALFLFTTWDKLEHNAVSYAYRSAAKKYLDDPIPAIYNLPFSMNDEKAMHALLHEAGFLKTSIENIVLNSTSPDVKTVVTGLTQGGNIYNEVMKRHPSGMKEIRKTVERELTEKYGASPMNAPMSAFINRGWK
jgi:SAM-dependent methyltransferase